MAGLRTEPRRVGSAHRARDYPPGDSRARARARPNLPPVDANGLSDRTRAWIDGDPDPETRAELDALLAGGKADELADRMAGSLEFGTAGLRGRVEAGSNRMNRAVIIRTTKGISDYLHNRGDGATGLIVVGRDARLSSEQLMRDTVGVLAAAGHGVRYFRKSPPLLWSLTQPCSWGRGWRS